ncbi:MAG TPA: hypothetical protein VKL19_18290 [Thermoanaerobaculia bacterium]|nr:hypothetical protein [Thermoanaerobaculia bacterium]
MITTDNRRITLVARSAGTSVRDWDYSNPMGSRIVFVDALPFLAPAIDRGVTESGYDLERVIIDGTATAAQFLELLTTLPAEFLGDILLVTRDGRGFLSSAGRGDGRVLYSLDERDLEFYLRANALLWATAPQAAIA